MYRTSVLERIFLTTDLKTQHKQNKMNPEDEVSSELKIKASHSMPYLKIS